MPRHSSLSSCTRRKPCQRRGELRVEGLLSAAIAEFSGVGYEAATMSAIARRAGAPIGSLYQFFPNKQTVARAVRTRQIEDIEKLWAALVGPGAPRTMARFVVRFVDLMLEFVDGHPAFLPLLDAPSSTLPVGPRNRLRIRLEEMLLTLRPGLQQEEACRMAEIVLNVNKALMGLYARASADDRPWIVEEYRAVLKGYCEGRIAHLRDGPASEEKNGGAERRRHVGAGILRAVPESKAKRTG